MKQRTCLLLSVLALYSILSTAFAQVTVVTNRPARPPAGPRVVSPQVSEDRKITFRILAPKAETVRLGAGDIQGLGQATALTKGESNVWEITVGPVPAGAYRYNFNVDGVTVIDPRNPASSESNDNLWSLVSVPGTDYADLKEVPHGAVAEVNYYSSTLKRHRRMHVYTPPGYEKGEGKFPVFYLLHGSSDSDNSWSTVGRAGFILDNLIAAGKAKPMVMVMPAGHTGPSSSGPRAAGEFERDFVTDVMPHIEKNYRVQTERKSRALAGLSMGGSQTLNIAFQNLDKFSYLGVFSSGIFSNRAFGADPNGPTWEDRHKQILENAALKQDLKLFWFATGKDDFLLKATEATVELFKKYKFEVAYKETPGAHTWLVWRDYLNEFAPQLFQ